VLGTQHCDADGHEPHGTPGDGDDQRALAWHAYLWHLWFLVWGLLLAVVLWRNHAQRIGGPCEHDRATAPGATNKHR